jgi:hypothetical protein
MRLAERAYLADTLKERYSKVLDNKLIAVGVSSR